MGVDTSTMGADMMSITIIMTITIAIMTVVMIEMMTKMGAGMTMVVREDGATTGIGR